VTIDSPQHYEVFQRIEGRASVPIQMSGLRGATAQVQILRADGTPVARQHFTLKDGLLSGVLEDVPEGGWYSLVIGRGAAKKALSRFGVGDVFVVAGQSNAAGHGDGFIGDRSGLVSVLTVNGRWKLAQDPEELPAGMTAGSPWPIMGELLACADRVPIGFINAAVGGTSTEQWLPNAPDNALYRGLKEALEGRKVRAVLWHQGESDAVSGFAMQRTFENMSKLITQSRLDAGREVPWYVALASYTSGASQEAIAPTREAQKMLYKHGLSLPGPDTDTHVPHSMRYDGTHLSAVGLTVHGILWFRALKFSR